MILLAIIGALFATLFVGAVLHELAHALAAVLMGLRVREIHFGGGPVLLRMGLGQTPIQIRLIPGQGLVRHHPVERWRRIRVFLFVAAGPICDMLVLAALIMASRQPDLTESVDAGLVIAVGIQGYCLFSNLWPRMVVVNGYRLANDGLQLLRLLTNRFGDNTHQTVYEAVVGQYVSPGQSLPPVSRRSPVLSNYVMRYVSQEPISPEMLALLESILIDELPACEQLLVLDTLITKALPSGDAVRLDDLDRWSARAFALAPDIATIRASRGSVLIEVGRAEEGLALLADGLNGQEFNDCLVHAFRALGHFKLGDAARAENEFAQAKALFRHEQWHGNDIAGIVERIGKTIGNELKSPATWSVEAARAAFRTQTSGPPAQPDIS